MGGLAPVSGGSGKSGVDKAEAARKAAEQARQQKAAAEKAAADAQKAAKKPGQTPEAINHVPQTGRQNTSVPRAKPKPRPSTEPEGHPKDKGWSRNWYEAETNLNRYVSWGREPVHVRITPRFLGRGTTRPDDLLLEMKLGGTPDVNFDDKQRYPNWPSGCLADATPIQSGVAPA